MNANASVSVGIAGASSAFETTAASGHDKVSGDGRPRDSLRAGFPADSKYPEKPIEMIAVVPLKCQMPERGPTKNA